MPVTWRIIVNSLACWLAHAAMAAAEQGPKLDFTRPVKYPQLIGIICGVVVFTATITTVFVLLCKSGSWRKFMAEMADPNAPGVSMTKTEKMAVVPSLSAQPELYEHLLQASRSLSGMDVDISTLEGRDITVRPMEKADIKVLYASSNGEPQFDESAYDPLRIWGWAALDKIAANGKLERMGPPTESLDQFSDYLYKRGPMTHIAIVHNIYKKAVGMISLSKNNPLHLSIEIDSIWITPAFQGHRLSHEAMMLVLGRLFELGYRRVTVQADARHTIFRKFLQRCGFSLEAVLRKHGIVHNRNRDTALYSILNSDWEESEVRLKTHIGLSLKPKMHNAIEIDSGRDVEKQILRDKKILAAKKKETKTADQAPVIHSEPICKDEFRTSATGKKKKKKN